MQILAEPTLDASPATIFTGGTTLDDLASMANAAHKAAEQAARSMLTHAKDAGDSLLTAKARLPHGEFGEWIAANCVFSARQAQNYMNLARRWDSLQKLAATEQPKTKRASHLDLDTMSVRQALTLLGQNAEAHALKSKSIYDKQRCPHCGEYLVKTSAKYATCLNCPECKLYGYKGGSDAPKPYERASNAWKEMPTRDRVAFVRNYFDELTRIGLQVADDFKLEGSKSK